VRVLDFGCGSDKFVSEGDVVVGLDKAFYVGVNVVQDVEENGVLPFADNEFDLVVARNSLEHVDGVTVHALVSEFCRVCKKTGKIVIQVPHCSTQGAFTFPHKSYYTIESFEPFLHDYQFVLLKRRLTFGWYEKPVEWLANLNGRLYEKFAAFIITVGGVYFELRPTKERKQGHY